MTTIMYLDKSILSLSTCKVWKISINFNGTNISLSDMGSEFVQKLLKEWYHFSDIIMIF